MDLELSITERFLSDFHDARPGVTSRAYGACEVRRSGRAFASGYDCLLEVIPRDRISAVVLDLACGDGFLLSRLAAREQSGLSLIGVDLSRGELEAARQRLGASAQFHRCRVQSMPLESASVDYVLSHLALMLMDQLEDVLSEIRRVLKPGGLLSAIVGAPPPRSAIGDAFLAVLREYPRKTALETIRFGDPRLRSSEGIRELLAPSFNEVEIEDIQICHRKTPMEVWDWFTDMYNIHMISPDLHGEIERRFVDALVPLSGGDGMLEFWEMSRQFTAVFR